MPNSHLALLQICRVKQTLQTLQTDRKPHCVPLHQMHVPVCVCAAANDTLRCQASVGCQKTFLFYFLFLSSVTVDLVSVHVCLAVF